MDSKPLNPAIFYGKRYRHVETAIDDIPDTQRNVDIVIIPPEPDYITDEDEVDEDDLQSERLPRDVPGEIEMFTSETEFDPDDDIPLAMLYNITQSDQQAKRARLDLKNPKWSKAAATFNINSGDGFKIRENKVKDELTGLNPVEIFEKLFNNDVINLLVTETNRYAMQHNTHNFSVSEEEIKIFLGILLFSGYHHLPRERLYWCLDEDVNCTIVTDAISRNRYYEIKRFFHLADNEKLNKEDRMCKLRPLIEKINKNFLQWGIFHQVLSIDEAMVKYFGHHSSKQFIRGKPIRFGFKDWMLCSATGYCYQFDTYCGAKENEFSYLPLGSRVVLELLKVVDVPSDHISFFDNFFTSHSLLVQLRDLGFKASGTIRDNRTKKCPLQTTAEIKKQSRGYFDYQYDTENQLLMVRWKDNNVVTMATNFDSIEPLCKVKRWSKEKKEKLDVPQPRLFSSYNKGMGGVDLLDQAVNNYRVTIQGKKWWWPLWTHILNVSVVNAWKLHSLVNGNQNLDLLDFVRNITRFYLRNFTKSTMKRKPASVPQTLLQSSFGHFPGKLKNQLRCRICHQRARWECIKCKATLCLERECFIKFHSVQ